MPILLGSFVAPSFAKDEPKKESATEDELLKIDGIGEIVAQSIIKYFLIDENKILLEQLISIGINPVYAEQEIEINNVFYDKNFVITGKFESFSRLELENKIKYLGGKITSSVSKNTNFLIAGESPGSKLKNDQKLSINKVDENEILSMLEIEEK